MPTLSAMCGIVLTALGLVAYLAPEAIGTGKDGSAPTAMSPTSLTPAVFGVIFLLAGLVGMFAEGRGSTPCTWPRSRACSARSAGWCR